MLASSEGFNLNTSCRTGSTFRALFSEIFAQSGTNQRNICEPEAYKLTVHLRNKHTSLKDVFLHSFQSHTGRLPLEEDLFLDIT